MSTCLDGKVAIETGASGGLGRSHALALAGRGAAAAVVAEIEQLGGEALANRCDVTDAGAVNDMVAPAATRWGRVDVLINNAGIVRDKSFAKMAMDDFRKVVDVHLMGLPANRRSPDDIAERWAEISDMSAASVTESAFDQTDRYVHIAINSDEAAMEPVQ